MPENARFGSRKLSRIIRLVAACMVVGLVPCSAQTRREQRVRTLTSAGSGEQLIQSHLSPGHTMANAPNAELVEAVCEAVKQSPARLTSIVDAVARVRRRQRIELLCRAVQCASDTGSLDCGAVVDLLKQWIQERPDEANLLLQRFFQCSAECGEGVQGQVGSGPSPGHGQRAIEKEEPQATPPPGPPPAPPPPPTAHHARRLPPGPPSPSIPQTITAEPSPPSEKTEFPFPPPRASAFEEIDRKLLVGDNPHPLLSDAAAALTTAFKSCGYGERSFYPIPNGFALASRLEHMNEDGTSSDDRWELDVRPVKDHTIESYLKALFRARPGHYRVIVFILTNVSFEQKSETATSEQANDWAFSGKPALPKEIGEQDYSDDHVCTALIYEFRRLGEQKATFVKPSEMTGQTHLEKSGLLSALAQPKPDE
jgi:hypothetical protein